MYKVIKRIERVFDFEDDGHLTHAITVYEPDREVELTDWPLEDVTRLLDEGKIEVIEPVEQIADESVVEDAEEPEEPKPAPKRWKGKGHV